MSSPLGQVMDLIIPGREVITGSVSRVPSPLTCTMELTCQQSGVDIYAPGKDLPMSGTATNDEGRLKTLWTGTSFGK